MTTRKKKISVAALLGLVPIGGILAYVASAIIKAHGFDEWKAAHERVDTTMNTSHEKHFDYVETLIDRTDQSTKEWRTNQADVNRRILDRLDVIIDDKKKMD